MRALPDRVTAELLYALQQRTMVIGTKTDAGHFRTLTDRIRMQEIGSVEEFVDPVGTNNEIARLFQSTLAVLRRRVMTSETERVKDEWDATVFGHRGIVRFDTISQRWLKEATKVWAFNDLPQRRGNGAKGSCQTEIRHMGLLSESLQLQRSDKGCDLTALGRDDITAFLNRIAFLQAEGSIRARRRVIAVRGVAMMLDRMRALGLTRPGQPLHGLPDDFAITNRDIPDLPENDEAGRDLPGEVMQVLCGQLDKLETMAGREVRVVIELLIDTGRRPDEICQLSLDCLERDQSGKPILVYTNYKANREGRRLPIPESTAALIESQQQRVRERFPDKPIRELKLLPTTVMNPHGRKSISDGHTSVRHRAWVDGLPDIFVSEPQPGLGPVDETATTPKPPFDKHRIFPYAYRHSYAQRHADAGVPVDVLCDLMDHRKMGTTQGYYRVGEQRRRRAIERVTSMQFDRHGDRVWREAKALLDSEVLRRAVGEIAVPYGTCSEPSNVAAGGQDCPVRFRCVGCSHFSTDVSYLPDLEAYLADLLRSRERLRSAFTAADDWAIAETMPSDDEITRIRQLISRIHTDVDELSDDERTQIEQAVGIVRRARTSIVGLGIPRTRQPLSGLHPDRSA
ncbi:site-specific integrase [Rhodococcus erythropolis]|uniref:site-specific integrase n=1 Tax=Rhodococcus erythropolis TaxID=1833 RepID=UPI00294A582B|nr:site-specific integrase [Rhodococcus erythropolis]MDV6278488.1 site-specific integrase [Rhodococcus erythropolis]